MRLNELIDLNGPHSIAWYLTQTSRGTLVKIRVGHDNGMVAEDAHVKERRELGVRRNSPLNIDVAGVWVERKRTCRAESNMKVFSKCSITRKS